MCAHVREGKSVATITYKLVKLINYKLMTAFDHITIHLKLEPDWDRWCHILIHTVVKGCGNKFVMVRLQIYYTVYMYCRDVY